MLGAFVPSSPNWRHCRTRQWHQHRRANLPETRPAFLAKASVSVMLQGPLHRFSIPSLACAVEFRVSSCCQIEPHDTLQLTQETDTPTGTHLYFSRQTQVSCLQSCQASLLYSSRLTVLPCTRHQATHHGHDEKNVLGGKKRLFTFSFISSFFYSPLILIHSKRSFQFPTQKMAGFLLKTKVDTSLESAFQYRGSVWD
jgi:hypothetical protein